MGKGGNENTLGVGGNRRHLGRGALRGDGRVGRAGGGPAPGDHGEERKRDLLRRLRERQEARAREQERAQAPEGPEQAEPTE